MVSFSRCFLGLVISGVYCSWWLYLQSNILLRLLLLVGVFILGCLLSLLISHLIGLLFLGPASAACYAFLLLESININQVISAICFMLGAATLCRFNLYFIR